MKLIFKKIGRLLEDVFIKDDGVIPRATLREIQDLGGFENFKKKHKL